METQIDIVEQPRYSSSFMREEQVITESAAEPGMIPAPRKITQRTSVAVLGKLIHIMNGEHPETHRYIRRSERDQHLTAIYRSIGAPQFSELISHVLQRRLFDDYAMAEPFSKTIMGVNDMIPDFKLVEVRQRLGGRARLPEIPRLGNYPARDKDRVVYSYRLRKFGSLYEMAWEDLVNDDLGLLRNLPSDLVDAARNTEEHAITELFSGASGWDSAFFTAQSSVSSAPLSISALKTAAAVMGKYKDAKNEVPIAPVPVTLMVGPALRFEAEQILRSSIQQIHDTAEVGTVNVMAGRFSLVVNSWLPLVATTGTFADTMWGLFASPRSIQMGEVGYHEMTRGRPQVFFRASNSNPADMEGASFESDAIALKVRHLFGTLRMDSRAAYVSNGQ